MVTRDAVAAILYKYPLRREKKSTKIEQKFVPQNKTFVLFFMFAPKPQSKYSATMLDLLACS